MIDYDEIDRKNVARGRAFNEAKRKEFHRLVSRYHGTTCAWCGQEINVGEEIAWHPESKACHVACFHEAFDSEEAEGGTLTCRSCGHKGAPKVERKTDRIGRDYLLATCSTCGAYIKNVPMVEEWLSIAEGTTR